MTIRFHLDENVHGAVADALRRRGIDVTTAADAKLIGATDEQRLAFAQLQGRTVVTHDVDSLRPHAQGAEHTGIAFCHAHKHSLRESVAALLLLAANTTAEEMANKAQYL